MPAWKVIEGDYVEDLAKARPRLEETAALTLVIRFTRPHRLPVMARSVGAERGQGVRVMCAYQAIEDREMGGC